MNDNELNETKEQIIELINKTNNKALLDYIYDFIKFVTNKNN